MQNTFSFYPSFQFPRALSHCKLKATHKITRFILISQQKLDKIFLKNIIIDVSHNLNKYIQYKHNEKYFEMVCLHLHTVTVIALLRLHGSEKLLKVFTSVVLYKGFLLLVWALSPTPESSFLGPPGS